MNTTTDALADIDRQIANLQQRRNVLAGLLKERDELEGKLNRVIGGEVTESKHPARKSYVLPRGVITLAAFEALKANKKPMHLSEVVEVVKKSPRLQGNIPVDLERRLRGVLQTSNQFTNKGGNTFVNASNRLEGRLFERLQTNGKEVAKK